MPLAKFLWKCKLGSSEVSWQILIDLRFCISGKFVAREIPANLSLPILVLEQG